MKVSCLFYNKVYSLYIIYIETRTKLIFNILTKTCAFTNSVNLRINNLSLI